MGCFNRETAPLRLPGIRTVWITCRSVRCKMILSSGRWDDRLSGLWDVSTGRLLRTLTGEHASFSPNGKMIVASSGDWKDLTVRLWDVSTGRSLRTLAGKYASFNPDGRTLASVRSGDSIRLWDVSTGRLLHTLRTGGFIACYSVPMVGR